jgi:hypothetical protein
MGTESHILVQAWNTGLTASKVYQNTTAVNTQGSFSSTALWSDTTGAGIGRFSNAPDGCMTYCNGLDACVWGGDEYRCSGFLLGDPTGTIQNDFTEKVGTTATDNNSIATLTKTSGTVDAYTKVLLHMDGTDEGTTFSDSSGNSHTFTAVGNANTETSDYRFATASCELDGSGDYLSCADHADYDLSAGTWTVDLWAKIVSTSIITRGVYFQRTDANNYLSIRLLYDATATKYALNLSIYAASSEVVSVTSSYSISRNVWTHLEVGADNGNYYLFADGVLIGHDDDANVPANYTGTTYIGCTFVSAAADSFRGFIDEFRLSVGICRHAYDFTPWSVEYGTNAAYVYIGATRMLDGVKFYVQTANDTASSVDVRYWQNSRWNGCASIVDGTLDALTSTKTLNKTGSITWTYVGTERPRLLNNTYLYWYQFVFSGIDDTTQIYFCTVDAPFQQIVDLWDGVERPPVAFFTYKGSKYIDKVIQVLEEDYVSAIGDDTEPVTYVPADPLTYAGLGSLTSSNYIVIGFSERMTAVRFNFAPNKVNTNKVAMSTYYWDGDTWNLCDGLIDGTRRLETKSISQDGYVIWDAPLEQYESKINIKDSGMWYFYKFQWNKTLSSGIHLDQVTGIPAQKTIRGYNYPVVWQNRVWLLGEHRGQQSSALCSSVGTVCVFNGTDAIGPEAPFLFGNSGKLVGGATLYTRFGGIVYDNLVVFKEDEVWLVDGQLPGDYKKYKISDHYGCVAPGTIKTCDTGYEITPGLNKHVLMWLSHNQVVMFDGNSINPVSGDVDDMLDPLDATNAINRSTIDEAEAFYDPHRYEYHLIFGKGTSTTKNVELVYDIVKKKWFKIDRTTGKYLECGFDARDTYGNVYTYGAIDTGYVEQLEKGATLDGTAITSTIQTGDIAFGGWNSASTIRYIKHVAVAKTVSTDSISISHYGEGNATATETKTLSQNRSGYRVKISKDSVNWGKFLFHSIKCVFSSSTETDYGYEPLGISILLIQDRLDTLGNS